MGSVHDGGGDDDDDDDSLFFCGSGRSAFGTVVMESLERFLVGAVVVTWQVRPLSDWWRKGNAVD